MNENNTLINLITNKEKLVAMLAPSFPIVFSYPSIITKLKQLGFSYVVEVAAGAAVTNQQLSKLMKENPTKRYITSPCPTIVRMIKKTMPEYEQYLTTGVDSPMVATAKLVLEKYPGYRPVFIGPCVMKKMEAAEEAPELNILVLTYHELQDVFDHFHIGSQTNPNDHFDISCNGLTQTYPLDGGLTNSSGANLNTQVVVTSGANNRKVIKDFCSSDSQRLLDILNCPGGCIFGPGIQSNLSLAERRNKILSYYLQMNSKQ